MMSMLNNQKVMVFVLIILISVNFLAGYLTLVMCSVVLSGPRGIELRTVLCAQKKGQHCKTTGARLVHGDEIWL